MKGFNSGWAQPYLSYICIASCFSGIPESYHIYATNDISFSGQNQKGQPSKRDKIFTPLSKYRTLTRTSECKSGQLDIVPTSPGSFTPKITIWMCDARIIWTHCGHHTNECWLLKHTVQDLIDSDAFAINPLATQNISQNLLSSYNPVGPSV